MVRPSAAGRGPAKAPRGLSPDSLPRVDQDSALHSDLQTLKEKEGADFILLNFSFKVSLAPCRPPSAQASPPPPVPGGHRPPALTAASVFSLRTTFPLTHRSSGLCPRSCPEGEWLCKGRGQLL